MGPTNPPKASRQHLYRVYHSETAGPGTPRHGPTEPSKGLAAAPLYIVPLRSCRTHPALGPPNPPKASRQHLLLYRSETARHTLPWAHRTLQRPRHSTSTVPLRNCRTRPTQPSKGLAAAPRNRRTHPALGPPKPSKASRQHLYRTAPKLPDTPHGPNEPSKGLAAAPLLYHSETAGHTPPWAYRTLQRPRSSTSLYCTAPKLPDTPRPGPTEPSKGLAAAPLIVPLRNCRTHPALGLPNPPKACRDGTSIVPLRNCRTHRPGPTEASKGIAAAPLRSCRTHPSLGPPNPPKASQQHLYLVVAFGLSTCMYLHV